MATVRMVSQPISKRANEQLVEISKARKERGELIKSKQDILSEAISNIHKKEVK